MRCSLTGWSLQFEVNADGLLSKSAVFLHNNARTYTAAQTAETRRKFKFEVMAHPPYSPDLAPSDYHLFGTLK